VSAKSLLLLAEKAKEASYKLRLTSTEQKNKALLAIAEELEKAQEAILIANAIDLKNASHLSGALLDRLALKDRLPKIIADVRKVVELSDPVGEIIESFRLDNGLKLTKKRIPIGVIGVIYEARPNVTVDISSLCLKTSNCAILRGGKETLLTNIELMKAIQRALIRTGIPKEALQLVENPSRASLKELVKLDHYIDLIIPRGGEGLHQFCKEESTIPLISGGIGVCHLFVDASADLKKAEEVIINAKLQRPSVCNALDTLLVHEKIAPQFLPGLVSYLLKKGVAFRLDSKAWDILCPQAGPIFQRAVEKDWKTEWMSLNLGIKVVNSVEEAIHHIEKYGSSHSDGILTETAANAALFVEAIDSGAVYVNASTRFTDGGQFGLGAEVAVSTQKLHARGPMGLKEITTYKWIGEGNYHVRGD
jgi:glutamate-5-semialdehyde dehydrogenase